MTKPGFVTTAAVLLFLSSLSPVSGQVVNPTNGHTYLLTEFSATYWEWRAVAGFSNGYVVAINDAAEEEWILQQFSSATPFWIGLTDEIEEGSFLWDSGEPLVYENWQPGAPDDSGDTVRMTTTGQWDDYGYTGLSQRAVLEFPGALLPAVENLDLGFTGDEAILSWTNPVSYDTIRLYRGLQLVAELPGSTSFYVDPFLGCSDVYTVVGLQGTTPSIPGFIELVAESLVSVPTTVPEGQIVDSPILIDNICHGSRLQGWSFGMCYQTDELELIDVLEGSVLAAINNGAGPDFYSVIYDPDLGFAVGVVLSFYGDYFYPEGDDLETHMARFEAIAPAPESTPLFFCGGVVGSPPVTNTFVFNGQAQTPALFHGSVEIIEPTLRRGDCNHDAVVDISDVLFLGDRLFGPESEYPCAEACESNGDAVLDIADMVYTIEYLFYGGPPLPAPSPECGIDPQPESSLGCAENLCP